MLNGLWLGLVVLAVLVGLLGLIPMIGATLGATIVALVAFFDEPHKALVIVIYSVLYQQFENYVVAPRVMQRTVSVPGPVTIVAALAGGGGQQDGDQNDDTDDASNRDQRIRPNVTWSPDGKSFSFVRRDQRKVKDLFLVNVLAQPRPVLIHYKYTMPGEEDVTRSELWTFRRGEKAVKQINGEAEERQLPDVRRALVYGNGGIFSHSAVAILGDGRY